MGARDRARRCRARARDLAREDLPADVLAHVRERVELHERARLELRLGALDLVGRERAAAAAVAVARELGEVLHCGEHDRVELLGRRGRGGGGERIGER